MNRRYLALVPIVSALVLACLFFLELPIYDYWDVLTSGLALGNAGSKDYLTYLWAPFVDQRMVFPKLTIYLLSKFTHNQHYALEIGFGFAARLAMLFFLWLLILKADLSEQNKTAVWLFAAFLLFWPLHQIIFQHRWYSTQYAWCLTPGILALYLLDRFWGRWFGILTAALACTMGCFSHGTGLPLFLAIGIGLLAQGGWSKIQKAIWWLLSGVVITAFLIGLPTWGANGFPPLPTILDMPWRAVRYVFQTFSPPAGILVQHTRARAFVGFIIMCFCVLPIILLYRKKQLFNRAAFPWLALILWCCGLAVLASLARSVMHYQPHIIYYSAMVLAPIGALPLWLAMYTKVWSTRTSVVLLLVLALIYIAGSKDVIDGARIRQGQVEWARSCLQYYPALDNHPLYIYPFDQIERFKQDILPQLVRLNALPDYVDATPFNIVVPTIFDFSYSSQMSLLESSFTTYQFRITGKDPYVVLKPSPAISKHHVISFTLESSTEADIKFYWNDGRGWFEEKTIALDRKGMLITKHWGYFPERNSMDRHRHVEEVRVKLANITNFPVFMMIRDIKVLTR